MRGGLPGERAESRRVGGLQGWREHPWLLAGYV
jgi:hypothetical protein